MSDKRPFWQDLPGYEDADAVAARRAVNLEESKRQSKENLPSLSEKMLATLTEMLAENRQYRKTRFHVVAEISLADFVQDLLKAGFSTKDAEKIADIAKDGALKVEPLVASENNQGSPETPDTNQVIPKTATELYKGRADTSEDGPAFFNRVYKDYIGKGLTRAVLDKLDHPLVARIDTLKRNKDPAALALDLPTAYAGPQKWADRVLAGEETVPEVADVKTHTRNRMRIAKARERAATKNR